VTFKGLIKHEISAPCSQVPATCPYPEPDHSTLPPLILQSSCLYRASMTIKTLCYSTDAQIYNS